jgi:hypothetical protein
LKPLGYFESEIRNKRMKPYHLLLLLILWSSGVKAQTYPVRTITSVSAPYPVSLNQFADNESGKVSVTLIPTDAKMQNYPVKLRLYLSGNGYKIYTNPDYAPKTINLNSGETQTLSGAELASW